MSHLLWTSAPQVDPRQPSPFRCEGSAVNTWCCLLLLMPVPVAASQGRAKTRREIEEKLGYPSGPAPGGSTRVPSFAHDNIVEGKGTVMRGGMKQVGVDMFTVAVCGTTGVPFGHKLKSTREILRAIGYPEPPAPGGTYRVPCHVLCMIVKYCNVCLAVVVV